MRSQLIAISLLLCSLTSAFAMGNWSTQVSLAIGVPGVNIGINVPAYPQLILIPGYPVYYDPRANSNYFFYDGLYLVFHGDNWYASSWYNGPWDMVGYDYVPFYVLRVPVRYYRQPPAYFSGWRDDAPPRWGEHWGRDWEQRRAGWDQWDRRSIPSAAPLPIYQREYSGDRYPRAVEQQRSIQSEHYRYQPREAVTQQHFERQEQSNQQRQQGQQRQQQEHQEHQEQQRPQAKPQDKARRGEVEPQDKRKKRQYEERDQYRQ